MKRKQLIIGLSILAVVLVVIGVGFRPLYLIFGTTGIQIQREFEPRIRDVTVLSDDELIKLLDERFSAAEICSDEIMRRFTPELHQKLEQELSNCEPINGQIPIVYYRIECILMLLGYNKEERLEKLLEHLTGENHHGLGVSTYYLGQLDPIEDRRWIDQIISSESSIDSETDSVQGIDPSYKAEVFQYFPSLEPVRNYFFNMVKNERGDYYQANEITENNGWQICTGLRYLGEMGKYDHEWSGNPELTEPLIHYTASGFDRCWWISVQALSNHYDGEGVETFLYDIYESDEADDIRGAAISVILENQPEETRIRMIRDIFEEETGFSVLLSAIRSAAQMGSKGIELVPDLMNFIDIKLAWTEDGRYLIAYAGDAIEHITGEEPRRSIGTNHYIHGTGTIIYIPESERGPDEDMYSYHVPW